MAPPNDPVNSLVKVLSSDSLDKKYFALSDGKLSVKGISLLSDVPSNVTFSPFSAICQSPSDAPLPLLQRVHSLSHKGGFLGFHQEVPSDRLMNSIGKFKDRNFLSIFRFKTWWSTMWVGTTGSDLQMESQWVLFDVPEIKSYVLILPVIDGSFRSAIFPGTDDHVMICAESGSTNVKASSFDAIAYVHVSDNPYNLMKEAFSAIRIHLNTFRLLEEKEMPSLVDKFGWCTWDAFYLTVEPLGIGHGLKEFSDNGVSPRFLIIDDGWQSINWDHDDPDKETRNIVLGGKHMTARLHRLDEAEKFRKYKAGTLLDPNAPSFDPKRPKMLIAKAIELERAEIALEEAINPGVMDLSELKLKVEKLNKELNDLLGEDDRERIPVPNGDNSGKPEVYGLKALTKDLRTKFKGLDNIYVWHALCGAWGGVRPGATHLKSKVIPCKVSPGLDGTMHDLAVVKIVEGGIGLVQPDQAEDFYNSMHSHLKDSGITGVKVDVIHTLEYISEEYGGRVNLAKNYYKGLTNSLVKNFNGRELIASMQQCNDFFYLGTKQISMARAGDDFWFQDPNGDPMGVYWLQGVHMIHCSYNSLWMGQMILPDWDMFQSDHCCAKFHAGSRAICGSPIYLSDAVGGHDFDLIKKLVFPDGTIPKCQHFALPTRDCLFKNPLFDQKTVLKIWNCNKYGGIVGAFNCQGAGWDSKEHRIRGYPECYKPISGTVHVHDIEWDQKKESALIGKAEEYVVYFNQAEKLLLMGPKSKPIEFTVQPSSFELFSFVPIMKFGTTKFAPIGLTNMFNSGGTIQDLEHKDTSNVKIRVKGGGNFLAYSSNAPNKCSINGIEVPFEWSDDGKLTVPLSWTEENGGISDVVFFF